MEIEKPSGLTTQNLVTLSEVLDRKGLSNKPKWAASIIVLLKGNREALLLAEGRALLSIATNHIRETIWEEQLYSLRPEVKRKLLKVVPSKEIIKLVREIEKINALRDEGVCDAGGVVDYEEFKRVGTEPYENQS